MLLCTLDCLIKWFHPGPRALQHPESPAAPQKKEMASSCRPCRSALHIHNEEDHHEGGKSDSRGQGEWEGDGESEQEEKWER